jgi:hypothetical protein
MPESVGLQIDFGIEIVLVVEKSESLAFQMSSGDIVGH